METEHYKPVEDFNELVERSSYWVRALAKTMGIWPGRYVAMRMSWYRRLYYFMLSMHWLNTFLQIEFFFRNLGNLGLVVQGLCSFVSICTTGLKVMRIHAYEDEIRKIWQALENATYFKRIRFLRKTNTGAIFAGIHQLLAEQWKEVQMNLRFYSLVVGLVALNYSVIPACSNLYNQFQGNAFNRSFVYNTYYPFLEPIKRRSPLFELLFCSESLSGYTTFAGVVAFDGLLIEKINEIFSPILLVQLFTSTSIICVIAFAASMPADGGESQTMLMVLYLIAAIYQLFQFCWYGQRLQNESTALPLSVYDVEWELCAANFKSSQHILLLYSQRQIDMRAWSFSAMSLETFSTIIRSAASYFTVLQTLAEE
uniref:Odorant receptor n=1 Tax=Anopheles farauti TaxID=69004 RepID=A0A182QB51_9DIPT